MRIVFRSESSSRTHNGCHCHKNVSKLQDLARTSYNRYLPTIICKEMLVLLSPPLFVLGYVPDFALPKGKPVLLVLLSPLPKDYVSTSVPPTQGLC